MCLFGFHSRHFQTYSVLFHLLFTMVCFLCVKTCSSLIMRNQNPKLTKVPSRLPTNIIKLDLAFNKLSELAADNFTGMTSMEELNLEANVIAHIDDLAFLSCLYLRNLNLRNIKIVHMHATLGSNSHNMIKFRIRGNPCIIEFPWLQQLRSIQVIHVTNPPAPLPGRSWGRIRPSGNHVWPSPTPSCNCGISNSKHI